PDLAVVESQWLREYEPDLRQGRVGTVEGAPEKDWRPHCSRPGFRSRRQNVGRPQGLVPVLDVGQRLLKRPCVDSSPQSPGQDAVVGAVVREAPLPTQVHLGEITQLRTGPGIGAVFTAGHIVVVGPGPGSEKYGDEPADGWLPHELRERHRSSQSGAHAGTESCQVER